MTQPELHIPNINLPVVLLPILQPPRIRLQQLPLPGRFHTVRLPQFLQLLQLTVPNSPLRTGQVLLAGRPHQSAVLQQILELAAQLGYLVETLLLETPPTAPALGVFTLIVPPPVVHPALLQLEPLLVRVQQRDGIAVVRFEGFAGALE